ncbi:hypothetical protein ACW5WQ_21150 [Aeromonas rivuli]|uniref:hypothetical protein n=1 Tax=Aeromonas rivuli TaxID=648794 RepID=UPI0005A6B659|nr:hypothetical protein [Aeromonas rivuli]
MSALKAMMVAMVLFLTSLLGGCAASYVEYQVSGSDGSCPPVVVAETAFGVKVQINEGKQCKQEREDE